jgi:hypothetical protein
MWKYNLNKESAINLIKEKRNCVEINLGFMVQLGKWEELVQYSNKKELKFYNFEIGGNISLLDKNELHLLNDDEFENGKFSIILMLHCNKFYKIISKSIEYIKLNEKVNRFINLLQKYENYPMECTPLYIETSLLNKKFLEYQIEEIIKYSS